MTESQPRRDATIEWAWAGRPFPGATESGDLHVVVSLPRGALVGVIDGLGHGAEAAEAATSAEAIVRANAELDIARVIERCHEGLRKTRGVVMSLAAIDFRSSSLDWFGVGNVDGVLLRSAGSGQRGHEVIRSRGGVLGCRLPPTAIATTPIFHGDVLVFTTDGIRSGYYQELEPAWEAQAIADRIVLRHARDTDDALALVARYQEWSS